MDHQDHISSVILENFPVKIERFNHINKSMANKIYSVLNQKDISEIYKDIHLSDEEISEKAMSEVEKRSILVSKKYDIDLEIIKNEISKHETNQIVTFYDTAKEYQNDNLIILVAKRDYENTKAFFIPPIQEVKSNEKLHDSYLVSIKFIFSILQIDSSLLAKKLLEMDIASQINAEAISKLSDHRNKEKSPINPAHFIHEWVNAKNGGAFVFLTTSNPVKYITESSAYCESGMSVPAGTSFGFYNPIYKTTSVFIYELENDLQLYPNEYYIEAKENTSIKKDIETNIPHAKQAYGASILSTFLTKKDKIAIDIIENAVDKIMVKENINFTTKKEFEIIKASIIETSLMISNIMKTSGVESVIQEKAILVPNLAKIVVLKNISSSIANHSDISDIITSLLIGILNQIEKHFYTDSPIES